MTDPGRWLFPSSMTTPPRLRLLCLPFAGGGTGPYRRWAPALPEGVDLRPVQLPGREARFSEKAYTSMAPLVRDALPALSPTLSEHPYVLFGHSMGAAIAFELARAAVAQGLPEPELLVLSARRAPSEPPPHPPLFALPKTALLERLQALYGPLPAPLMQRPHLLDMFLPTMRADFQLIDAWRPLPGPRLSCPVLLLGGEDDPAVPPSTLAGWADWTTGPVRTEILPGGHFFLRDREEIIGFMGQTIAQVLDPA